VAGKRPNGTLHVLDMWSGKGVHPSEQVERFFEMHFRWMPDIHGVEAVAYQRALIGTIHEEMGRKAAIHGSKAFFEIIPILHGKTAKVPRIEGILAPRYRAGYITHQRYFPELVQEAVDWPNGKKDHMDATAMAIHLLNPVAFIGSPEDTSVLDGVSYREITDDWMQQCP
jgi:hypothetical protein